MVKGLKLEEVSRDADGVRFFVGLSGVAMPTNNRLMNQFLIVLEFAGLVTVLPSEAKENIRSWKGILSCFLEVKTCPLQSSNLYKKALYDLSCKYAKGVGMNWY